MTFSGDPFFNNSKLFHTASKDVYNELKEFGYDIDEPKYRYRVPLYETEEEYSSGLVTGKPSTIRKGVDAYQNLFNKDTEQQFVTDGVHVFRLDIANTAKSTATTTEYLLYNMLRLKAANPSAMPMHIHSHPKMAMPKDVDISQEALDIISALPSTQDFRAWSSWSNIAAGGIYSKVDHSLRIYSEPQEPEQVKVGYKLAVEYEDRNPVRVRWAGEDEVETKNLKLVDPTKDEWSIELHNLMPDIAQVLT